MTTPAMDAKEVERFRGWLATGEGYPDLDTGIADAQRLMNSFDLLRAEAVASRKELDREVASHRRSHKYDDARAAVDAANILEGGSRGG